MALPAAYAWLAKEPGPRMLQEALKLYGLLEVPGPNDNGVILKWADELGVSLNTVYSRWVADWYNNDSIAWCGLFMAYVAMKSNVDDRPDRRAPNNFLAALSWASFGEPVAKDQAMLGDVLVFVREGGGHVGIYVGEDSVAFHVLGGNQGDAVSILRISKSRLYAVRRTPYLNTPANVRKVRLKGDGRLSSNEA